MAHIPHGTPKAPNPFGAFFLPLRDSYPWLTLNGACSTLLADQLRRFRYSVALCAPYESLMVQTKKHSVFRALRRGGGVVR